MIVCCAATALSFLIGVVDDSYAARGGGGGGGFSRGGAASGGSFSPGQGRVGDGVVGQRGVYYGTVAVLPCVPTVVSAGEVAYYSCGTAYFTPGYYPDGSVGYVQVEPPPGY